MPKFTVITGGKTENNTAAKINQDAEIAYFDEMLTKTQDERNNIQWFKIPEPPICSIESQEYIEESYRWIDAVNKAWEKIEALDMKIGAIYARAERELDRDNYKKLLRRRHVKIESAKSKIEEYNNLKGDVEKGLGEIYILPISDRYGREEPDVKIHRGNKERRAFNVSIVYENEEELHDQIKEAFNKYHYYDNMVKQIEREVNHE